MIDAADTLPDGSVLEAEILVVGSGAAGIPLALELAARGHRVLLLEGGRDGVDAATQALYAGSVADAAMHSPPDTYRQRRLGGSTAIWGGRCMPFDPIDFEARDWWPGSGWPITHADVAPYYAGANEWLEAGANAYRDAEAFEPGRPPMIAGFTSTRVHTDGLERFSRPTDLYARYRRRLALAPGLRVVSGANVTAIRLAADGQRVDHLEVATLAGKRLRARGEQVVLAVGGIETPRLLLASNDVHPAGIGNAHDLVGRYYQCHIAGNVGVLRIDGPTSRVRHGYEQSPDGIYCRRRIQLAPEEQRQQRVGNIVFRLHFPKITDPAHHNGVLSGLFMARRFISYEYGKRLNDGPAPTAAVVLAHLRNIVFDAFETTRFLWHWLTRRTFAARKFPSVILRNRSNLFSLEVHGEQLPHADSRITLGTERDALGVPKVHIDWRYSPEDVASVRRSLAVIAEELRRAGVGTLDVDDHTLERELMRFGAYGGHHIGTARMGHDPATSVVDADGRVHGVANLYIASSAVFPTSGQANPTLLITALALRLVDRLDAVQRGAAPKGAGR